MFEIMKQLISKQRFVFSIVTIDRRQQVNSLKFIDTEHNKNTNQITSIAEKQIPKSFFSQFSTFDDVGQIHISQSTLYNQSQSNVSKELIDTSFFYQVIQLAKFYTRQENKFIEIENNFAFKLIIFYDKCRIVKLSFENYIHDVSIMLLKIALNYFYKKLNSIIT